MYLLEKLSGGKMSSKSKDKGFNVTCDEKSGKILEMSKVNSDDKGKTETIGDFDPGRSNKHHLSNSGTKRPGSRR
jgi:hypothetical protein